MVLDIVFTFFTSFKKEQSIEIDKEDLKQEAERQEDFLKSFTIVSKITADVKEEK